MLAQIHSLHVTKEKDYYNLKAILKNDNGYITFNSKIDTPSFQISTTQDDCIKLKYENSLFKPIILNKSASFHFNANAIADSKNNSLFTLTMDKKEKSYIPKNIENIVEEKLPLNKKR